MTLRPGGMMELIGVSKAYNNVSVLSPLDLEIPAGRTTVLIGPSGCGKSTLLRLMIGLIRPDTGTLRFDGTELTSESAPSLRRRMGYVIQDGGLFPHLTARDNVIIMARHLGWNAGRVDSRLVELAELARFPVDALARYPAQLSGGQRQRVSLMRALMLDPEAILLDEPLGALDPMIRADMQTDLREIFRSLAKTVVLVTHDLGEAGFLGDDILLLREGCIVQRGMLEEMIRCPAEPYVTQFVNAQRSLLTNLRESSS